ncbi:MAG: glutathione S-transferase [Maricaulis sp.]|jgi:glutathione S-transferase|nr:glutathione S-transferase [Maricaulis sp.]MDG2044604.1 glutathione S-transferase [Maricaulis sp.]
MITVHHLNNSRSQRVLWLLEELGLQYEIKKYMRHEQTMRAPADLKAVHPLGKSPVITDGDITVAETGAIIEYIIDTYGEKLRLTAGTEDARRYTYWLHFAEGSMMSPLLLKLVMERIATSPVPFFVKPITKMIANKANTDFVDPEIANLLNYIESELASRDWFAGNHFSGADIAMSFPLEAMRGRAGLDASYVKIHAYLDKIHARPAYMAALERGGEYTILGS